MPMTTPFSGLTRKFLRLAASSALLCQSAWALDCTSPRWVTAWQASPSDASPIIFDTNMGINFPMGPNQSYREVFSPLGKGSTLRLKLSNRFGKLPLILNSVRLARQSIDANIDPTTLTPVRFNGQTSVTVPAGQDIFSDPVSFNFNSLDKLAVSIATGATAWGFAPTEHAAGREYSFVTAPGAGDHTADTTGAAYLYRTTRRHMVIGMDALAPANTSTIVTLGDSITDGAQLNDYNPGGDERYPDYLKRRIDAAGLPFFVANAGIGGNRVATDNTGLLAQAGLSALSRYNADVLQQSGVTDVIILEGINDIGIDVLKPFDFTYRYNQIIGGYETLIKNMQLRGLRVMQGTLTPTDNATMPTYSGLAARKLREKVNLWIRTKSPADTIVDFDAAVRDPNPPLTWGLNLTPNIILKKYDTGDGLHFNKDGYARMADAIDLSRLKGSACR